jgi:hypothetical protein
MTQAMHLLIAMIILTIIWHLFLKKFFVTEKEIQRWQTFWDKFF